MVLRKQIKCKIPAEHGKQKCPNFGLSHRVHVALNCEPKRSLRVMLPVVLPDSSRELSSLLDILISFLKEGENAGGSQQSNSSHLWILPPAQGQETCIKMWMIFKAPVRSLRDNIYLHNLKFSTISQLRGYFEIQWKG